MKQGGPLKRSEKPMAPGGLRNANKTEVALWKTLVDQVGCAVCRFVLRIEDTPAEIHHLLDGQRRISHKHVLPLCPVHHRQGIEAHPSRHSVNGLHGGLDIFERAYESEMELVIRCEDWINYPYVTGLLDDEQPQNGDDRDTDSYADDQPDDGHARPEVEQMQAFDTPVHIRVTHYRARLCDPDNLNAKGVIDALVEGGLLRDDSAKEVETITHEQVKVKGYDEEKTRITITEAQS